MHRCLSHSKCGYHQQQLVLEWQQSLCSCGTCLRWLQLLSHIVKPVANFCECLLCCSLPNHRLTKFILSHSQTHGPQGQSHKTAGSYLHSNMC